MELMVPLCSDTPWQCSPEKAREHVQYLTRGMRDLVKSQDGIPRVPYIPRISQDFTFVNRLQWGLASVLAGMRTEAAFRPLIEPWVKGGMLPIPD
jgi:hypothetical protein